MSEHLPSSHLIHAHCFTSSKAMASELLRRFPKLYLGFTGVITFKTAGEVRDVVALTPLRRILLETDGPYMAPLPHRGSVAHPGHIVLVAEEVAKIKQISFGEVLSVCRENARQIYGF